MFCHDSLTVRDTDTGKKYVVFGSDHEKMVCKAIGELVQERFQDVLLKQKPYAVVTPTDGFGFTKDKGALHGLMYNHLTGKAYVDGLCGLSSVEKIVNACGYSLKPTTKRSKTKSCGLKTTGFLLKMLGS